MYTVNPRTLMSRPSCPVQHAVELIGSKWTLLILHQLCTTARGFNELLHGIEGINPRSLSLRLKDMVARGLVVKTVSAQTPIRVSYSLTPAGAKLKHIITQLGEWADALPTRKGHSRSRAC